MSVADMSKMTLLGIDSHKDQILNALHKTGCVEIVKSETDEFTDTFCVDNSNNINEITEKLNKIDKTIDFYHECFVLSQNKSFYNEKVNLYCKNFFVSYNEFINIPDNSKFLWQVVDETLSFIDDFSYIKSERVKINNLIAQLNVFKNIDFPFSYFKNTNLTKVYYGFLKEDYITEISNFANENDLFYYDVLSQNSQSLILVVCHNSINEKVSELLNGFSFSPCTFNFDVNADEKIKLLKDQLADLDNKEQDILKTVCAKSDNLKSLKIFSDYYNFLLEKEENSSAFNHTQKTFILNAYLPTDMIEEVNGIVSNITNCVFIEFSKPTDSDIPPTLLKNRKAVKQAEFVTDMYSVPNYREIDPNKAVFFFFMFFMGLIMADMGYGLIMISLGLILSSKIKVDNGTKRLWNIIAIGGIFTIIFGALFNSFLGFSVLPITILKSPVPENGMDNLMSMLLLCLLLGVIQITIGYLFKALNCFKSGNIIDAIFDGIVWVLFFIGFIFATFNFLIGYLMPNTLQTMNPNIKHFFDLMTKPGLFTVIGCIVIEAVSAGRYEKGFGKFSKGFGAVYGLINIMSDILSYARLFGLMLSGMIIATTFNNIGIGIMTNFVGYILGGLIMILGHTFNIAMGVLGAYIHDSRLQYIEFFSKFYTGEGRKFNPFGSRQKYIYIQK